jgi:hypothetical protein
MRSSWKVPHELKPDMHVLRSLVWSVRPAFHAIIGPWRGYEICCMADAMRYRIMGFRTGKGETPKGRIRVFHRGYGLAQTKNYIKRIDSFRRPSSSPLSVKIGEIASFVAGGDDYRGWDKAVEEWAPYNQWFGLVVHTGLGKDHVIRNELNRLVPLMDHSTTVVLCGLYRTGAHARFHTSLRKGWDGIRVGNLGILQMRKGVKPCRETA